jgi:hypothetical protein
MEVQNLARSGIMTEQAPGKRSLMKILREVAGGRLQTLPSYSGPLQMDRQLERTKNREQMKSKMPLGIFFASPQIRGHPRALVLRVRNR